MEERPLILVTGANGQLGQSFRFCAPAFKDVDMVFLDRAQLDISNAKHCRKTLEHWMPDIVINCAAYTNVEKAEDEPEAAMMQNGTAPAFLAVACALTGAHLIHFSTDYVFDGNQSTAYVESDAVAPISSYGSSKLSGERGVISSGCEHWIFRVAWLYSPFAHNFYKTMLRFGKERPELKVVADQWGAPTNAIVLANDILHVCCKWLFDDNWDMPTGIYHYAHSGKTTWHGFASEIIMKSGLSTPVVPVTSAEFPTKARRPMFSLLDASLFFEKSGCASIDWKTALDRCIQTHHDIDNLRQ
jgi:dTDP-4-dehydrorhamnose reductase